jgi:UDP-glucuronate 4-epimerase
MTVLVTGGAGFIGSHLVAALLEAGEPRVVVVDNFNDYYKPDLKRANALAWVNDNRVEVVVADFCEQAAMHQLFARERFRHVIHLGGSPGVPHSVRHPAEVLHNNVQGTLALLEAAREQSAYSQQQPVERFLFSSSSTVYGQGALAPFVEDAPLGVPASPYGVSKRAAELLGLNYFRLHQVPFVSLRLFNVYGPRLRPELSLAAFAQAVLSGQTLKLFGDGSVRRDFTHVSDICRGIIAALTAPNVAGECINLGHDEPVTIRELIRLIEQAAGRSANIEHHPPRGEDLPLTHADLSKARRLLGYEARVALADGVQEYVKWLASS